MKIISGGQTGADRGALIAAKELGLQTGGWMPKGFRAQDGDHPEFEELYGVVEHESPNYQPRTALNVRDSDATIRIATNFESPGERLTLKMIRQYCKPYLDIDPLNESHTPERLVDWLRKNNVKILNVAGNSERTSSGIEEFTTAFIHESLKSL